MFCHKCGTKIAEDAAFCQKCGAKVVCSDAAQQTPSISMPIVESGTANIVEPSPQESAASIQPVVPMNVWTDNQDNFKEFVDNRVRTTTKFNSADDLLKNAKPFTVLWICFGAVFAVCTIAIFPMGILVGALFGYVSAYLVGRVNYFRIYKRHCTGELHNEINLEDLIGFLNANLRYLLPYIGEWVYCGKNSSGEETISCNFSKNIHAIITFFESPASGKFYAITSRKSNVMRYVVITHNGPSTGKTDAGFGRLACLCKAAPIIKAAMEYYLASIGSQEVANSKVNSEEG